MNETAALAALTARVRHDVELTRHPHLDWMPERRTREGAPLLDVLIVGAGQGGVVTAFQLMRERVANIRVVDKAPRGSEGPWTTYARMATLRSPKDYTGPDLGIPSLTYRSWHEARYGAAHWDALHLIAKEDWNDYLLWYRDTLGIPVENDTELCAIAPDGDHLAVTLRGTAGERVVHTRKLVLATGQDGTGRWYMPNFVARLPRHLRAATADGVDFGALAGKRVAVLGAGASAADNAASALEAGAAEVRLFCRRVQLQRVQPYRWLTFAGFLRHIGDMDDAARWRFMSHVLGLREGIPVDTYARVRRFPNFHIEVGAPWTGAETKGDAVRVETPRDTFEADYLISCTGIDIDFARRPELAPFADRILTWGDRYAPPPEEADARLARYPYLAPDGHFLEKVPGDAPFLRHVFDFTIGATMSFGPSGCSINAMKIAVPRLVAGITRGLFREDLDHHWASLAAYDVAQFELAEVDHDK